MKRKGTVTFKRWICDVNVTEYAHDRRTALQLTDVDNGAPVATATVNLPDEPLGEGEVFIKDWSENRGIYEALFDAGIIGPIIERVPTGRVMAYRVRLLPETDEIRTATKARKIIERKGTLDAHKKKDAGGETAGNETPQRKKEIL